MKKIVRIVFFLVMCSSGMAQTSNDDCLNALNLCPSVTYSSSNIGASTEFCANCADGANSTGAFCYDLDNSVWFSFTTNSVGGNASVNFSNLNCLLGTGQDNQLQAAILSAATPCDATTYTLVSNCVSAASGDFVLNATGLSPNTTYYIQVDGDLNGPGITSPAECSFEIELSGTAVEFITTQTVVDQTCGNTDGQITITSTDGGSAPYQYALNNGALQSGTVFSNLTSGAYTLSVSDANGCVVISDTVLVNLLNGPQITLTTPTQSSCNGNDGSIDVTTVTGGTPAYSYSLNGGAGQAGTLFSNLSAGSYYVHVVDQSGCEDSVNVIVPNQSGLSATSTSSNADCGMSNGQITISVSGASGAVSYSLNGGASQSSPNFNNLSPGSYTVVITDAAGCTYELTTIVVSENSPSNALDVSLSASSTNLCVGDNATFTASSSNAGANPNYDFFVNGVSVQNGSGNSFSSSSLNDGDVVTCVVSSSDPCVLFPSSTSNSYTMTVNPVVNPTVTLSSNTTSACSNEPVIFTANPSGCNGTETYQWMVNGSPVQSDTLGGFTSTFPANATVSVNMTCSEVCSTPASSNSIALTITPISANAGSDQVIGQGQTAQLQGSGGGSYSWNPASSLSNPNIANPLATPNSTTTYYLIVTNNGCTDTAEVTVYVTQPIQIPNTFTPNGDGVNDVWEIHNIDRYPNCKVTVYDRWGQRVYNSIGYNNQNAWDGTNHGLKIPAATYYYVIDLNSGAGKDGDVYAGSITLVF